MGSVNWIRIDNPPDEFVSEFALVQRFYRPRGRQWPLLAIAIYPPARQVTDAIKVCVDYKDDLHAWWEAYALPTELIDELIGILNECKK